jgi:predicted O-methyltransferase YrrM
MSEYDFTADYFSNNISSWEKIYQYLSTTFSSDLNCLEIGTYEGRSAIYILDNFVGSSGKLTVIDNFWDKEYERRYLYNIKNNTKNKQVITFKGTSMSKLSLLHFNSSESFDFIYIDAGKTASTNMYNLLMSERLLKVGGIMIVDDYNWHLDKNLDPKLSPNLGINTFMDLTLLCEWYEAPKYQAIIVKKNPNSTII